MTTDPETWGVAELLKATGGRLVSGSKEASWGKISTDSRSTQAGEFFLALTGEIYDGHEFVRKALDCGAKGLIVNEAYISGKAYDFTDDLCIIAVPDTLKALGDIATFRRRQTQASVVAITGTNGKTTTKEMTAAVMGQSFSVLKTEGNFNNLIGLPLTLFRLRQDHEWAILELAMNHPGEIRRLAQICEPQLGIITNIAAGHLEGVKDIDGVMEAKGELLEVLGEDGTAILNIDDPRICRLAEQFHGRVISFGIYGSAQVWASPLSQTTTTCSFDLNWYDKSVRIHLKIPGNGAIYNALAAAAVGYRLGLEIGEVKDGLEATSSLAGRMQIIALSRGIHVINDTYNANPGSMVQAIETLCSLKGNGRGILIIGDMLELGQYSKRAHKELGVLIARSDISGLYATGEFAQTVAQAAEEAGMNVGKLFVGNQQEILETVTKHLGPGDWLLVKGSRLMAMEKVVEGLKVELGK